METKIEGAKVFAQESLSDHGRLRLPGRGRPTPPGRHAFRLRIETDYTPRPVALLVPFGQLHHIRSPQEPVDTHLKLVGDLPETMDVENFQARVLKLNYPSPAKPNGTAEPVRCKVAGAAG